MILGYFFTFVYLYISFKWELTVAKNISPMMLRDGRHASDFIQRHHLFHDGGNMAHGDPQAHPPEKTQPTVSLDININ